MSEPTTLDALGRLQVSMQRTRAAAFVLLYAITVGGRLTGQLDLDARSATLLLVVSLGSALGFEALYRSGGDRKLGFDPAPIWMALDVLFITWGIHVADDVAGPWLVWYLANTAAAAFFGGHRAATLVALGNSLAYITLLWWRGDIQGFDESLLAAGFRLLLVYGAGFIFLRGIADLRRKRLEIRELVEEKSRRLQELGELAGTLDRRTQELAAANLESQEASRAKSQFLANMSHELRTPLNSIIGFSEILVEKVGDDLDRRYGKFLGNILQSGRHLLRLINDILDLSKIEAGKMELTLERVAIRDVVQGVRSVMLGISSRRRIDLELDLPEELPHLVADGPKVKQILYNLLSNAVKFSPDGSVVTLGARPLAPTESPLDSDSIELWVTDRGLGIAPEHHQLIFEEFRQVDGASSRTHGGTGLGLTLVKRFVQMHGGRVRLESAPSEGSTFRVYLPLDASQVMVVPKTTEVAIFTVDQLEAARRALDPEGEGRSTVLIVEDDDTFGRALVRDLEAAGYRPVWARHGDDALRLVHEVRPAVVTLDLALPGTDGWEILKALKSEPSTARVPVIIVSLVENHELGFALGADDYFLKPLERRQFLARLEDLVADPASTDTGSPPHRVLLIDDDPQVQDLLDEALEDTPFQIVAALDGRSGLALARREQPAVIVLDLMMPGMNGFEVAAKLREDPTTAKIPVVVLTAKDLSAEDRSHLLGTTEGLLTKAPMDRAELVRTIQEVTLRSAPRSSGFDEDSPRADAGSGVEGDQLATETDSHPDQQQDRDTGQATGQTEP